MAKTRKQLETEIASILGRGAPRYRGTRKTTWGKFLVYATPADLEGETTTLANARRMAAKLRRLGYRPIIKRHASDGIRSWNEVIEDAHTSALVRR
jgi:hypothetical protein